MNRSLRIVLAGLACIAVSGAAFGRDGNLQFAARLQGAREVPPVATPIRANISLKFKRNDSVLKYELEVKRVPGNDAITVAHLHCAPEGVNGPIVAHLLGDIPGNYFGSGEIIFAVTDANILPPDPLGVCGRSILNLADLAQAAAAGLIYANVHSVTYPNGVARGQLKPD
jgi:hypothetical protein